MPNLTHPAVSPTEFTAPVKEFSQYDLVLFFKMLISKILFQTLKILLQTESSFFSLGTIITHHIQYQLICLQPQKFGLNHCEFLPMRREVALDRCLVSTTCYSRHRALGGGQGRGHCLPGVAAGPLAGFAPGPQPAGGSAEQPALRGGSLLLLHAPAELRASLGGAALALPALRPETVSAAQILRPQLPALTSSGSGMMQRGWWIPPQHTETNLQFGNCCPSIQRKGALHSEWKRAPDPFPISWL